MATPTSQFRQCRWPLLFVAAALVALVPGVASAGVGTSDYQRAEAADGTTQLPLWLDADGTSLWVRIDAITAGASTHFCLYHGHRAGTAAPLALHTEAAVFSYSSLKPIYYAVSGRHDAPGAAVGLVSHAAGNQVQRDGATTVNLADGTLYWTAEASHP